MAQRRYKSAAISAAGKNQKPEQAAPAERLPLGAEASPSPPVSDAQAPRQPEPEPAASEHFSTGLKAQLDGMRAHAAEPQRYAQPSLEQVIASIPGLSHRQRLWLHAHPHGLHRFDLLNAAHQMAQQHGIVPDSDDYFRVLESALHHYGGFAPMPTHAAPPAPMPEPEPMSPPMPEPPPMPHATHVDIETADHDDGPQPHHYAAPPSREAASFAMGEPELSGRVTLSPQELDHARAAGVTAEEYGKQKLKMMRAKKSGLIKD